MAYATILAEVKTTIEAVANIGKVHDFRRHSTTWKQIFDRHKNTVSGKLLNWEITRAAENMSLDAIGNAVSTEPFYRRVHGFSILGVQAVAEAAGPANRTETAKTPTETEFQDLVETVMAALRVNNLLNETVLLPIVPQAPIIGHDMFAGTLCHICQIVFGAVERVGG